jgi:thioredoxin-dependent peroxiredoxin
MLKSVLSILLLGFTIHSTAAPVVGDAAPDFQLQGSDGKTYTLSQFRGVKPVVIAFFPKAFTSG